MLKENEIMEIFKDVAFVSGGEFYFPCNITPSVIEQCTKKLLAVTGIDFFHIDSGRVIPVTPINSVDTSRLISRDLEWELIVNSCNTFAKSTVRRELERDSKQYCNLVLLELET